MNRLVIIYLFFVFAGSTGFSQPLRYAVLRSGFGLPFGAYGLNVEYRISRFGGYAGAGFMKKQYYDEVFIPPSFNIGAGLKYYFLRTELAWHPVAGVHCGWLNNYYHKDIGQNPYTAVVYGFAFLAGLEMKENIWSFEMCILTDPGNMIFKPAAHPSYTGKVYFTPSIGIGVNIYALRTYFKERKKLKEKEETDITIKIEINAGKDSVAGEITASKEQIVIENITKECNDTLNYLAVRKLLKDKQNNYLACKQIDDNAYFFIRFKSSQLNENRGLVSIPVKDNTAELSAFIIVTDKNMTFDEVCLKAIEDESADFEIYECKEGTVDFYYYGNFLKEFSVKASDMKFVRKSSTEVSERYLDEIFICFISDK